MKTLEVLVSSLMISAMSAPCIWVLTGDEDFTRMFVMVLFFVLFTKKAYLEAR